MKKLFLIFAAVVVLIAFAVPAFAQEMYDPDQRLAKLQDEKASVLKASGELTFGTISPFDSETADIGFANMYVDFTLWPDQYNSVLIEVAGQAETFARAGADIVYFELRTDVGSYFGLPVGLTNTAGITSLYTNKYEVSGHAYERDDIRSNIDPLAWKFKADAGMVQVTAALGFGETDPTGDGLFNDIGVYAFVPDVAGIAEIEAWYLAQDDPDYKGKFGFSAKADGLLNGLLGVAGGFAYDTTDAADTAEKRWFWGVGASVDYMMAAIGVSASGNEMDTLRRAAIDADVSFGDFGLVGTAAVWDADPTDSNDFGFYGAEIAGYVKVGSAKWTVGYEITEDGYAYSPAVVTSAPDGGFFVVADIDF